NNLNGIDQAGMQGLDSVFRFPAIQAQTKEADESIFLELLYGVRKFGVSGPAIVPNMILKKVDGISAEPFANEPRVLEHVVGGKDILEFVIGRSGPFIVFRRNFGGGIQALSRVACHNFTEQAIALAVAISPCAIKKSAAGIDCQLQRLERFAVVRTAPAAHAPKPVSNFTDFETRATQPAIFHERSRRPGEDKYRRGSIRINHRYRKWTQLLKKRRGCTRSGVLESDRRSVGKWRQ